MDSNDCTPSTSSNTSQLETSAFMPRCSIHIDDGKSSKEALKQFSKETLQKCQKVLVARTKYNMKYQDVCLPNALDDWKYYHSSCYRKFTAIKKSKTDEITEKDIALFFEPQETILEETAGTTIEPKPTRSKQKAFLRNQNTGILKNTCIFCDKRYRYKGKTRLGLISCSTKNFESKIKNYASSLKDYKLLSKILDTDFIAKEVCYHSICRLTYQKRYNAISKRPIPKQNWHLSRDLHRRTMVEVSKFIDVDILEKHNSYYLSHIHNLYLQQYSEFQSESEIGEVPDFNLAHLRKKLLVMYGSQICFSKFNNRTIIHAPQVNVANAIQMCTTKTNTVKMNIQNTAFYLRREIMKIQKKILPNELLLKHVYDGECTVPDLLKEFLESVLCGPRIKKKDLNVKMKVDSISQDIVFCATNGRLKPSKHMELGLVMKNLTGSRKVIDILNKLGHSASYTVIEGLETELTFAATKPKSFIPSDVTLSPDLNTSLAFDNFDRFVETSSGKDTLHDTVCILYQNMPILTTTDETIHEQESNVANSNDNLNKSKSIKRRRAFTGEESELQPYYKKPKLIKTISVPLEALNDIPQNYSFVKNLDNLWMFFFEFFDNDTPMWTGWNSTRIYDTLPQQKIFYLAPINASPTSMSTVIETLNRAQIVADECQQKYISVTYDLAIAKMAYQIQSVESPKFDNIFIHLGAFHIEMSFFKALGKYIEESGGPSILTESLVLAEGSLKGFLTGTHYNRCKRIHTIFSTALQLLHFRQYLQTKSYDLETIKNEIHKIEEQNQDYNENLNLPPCLKSLLEDYERYCQQTQSGEHGATAQFWITYIHFFKLYIEFSRSIRTNDIQLFKFCLLRISSLMFAMNHQNYSRWIIKYYSNLVNIDTTHPGLSPLLENGGISIKRTKKNFSRTSVDLTLEQTINADAANKLKGISNITNSISARKRWALSHSIRTTLTSHMLEALNINKREDVTNASRPHVVKKDNVALKILLAEIENNINPFNCEINKECLFNISTGKSASDKTKEFLLNIVSIGDTRRNNFITDCATDKSRFEKSIRKQEVSTFASENKIKIKKSNGKMEVVRFDRDLTGRILALSLENKIDLMSVLSFPLTPVPLSLGHIDGSLNKTDKSSLFKLLEKEVTSQPPDQIHCTIIDGFFLLHLIGETPQTFGKLAVHILKKVCHHPGNTIHLVFDKFISPSIKDIERDKRASLYERNTEFCIQGPEQRRPSDFKRALRNDNFKQSLVKFCCEFWKNDICKEIIGNKIIYVNSDDICFKFSCIDEQIQREVIDDLSSSHEEADTRIIFHMSKVEAYSNVVIRASDTDIIVIILGNMHKLPTTLNIWMEIGTASKNTCRFVDIRAISNSLGPDLCKALPAFHSLTGCDYTAAFSGKGKVKPFALLRNDNNVQKIFGTFGQQENISREQVDCVEKFICAIYKKAKLCDVNEARFDIFMSHIKPTKKTGPLDNLKKMDGSMLPPCKSVLEFKIKRLNQVCAIWNSATLKTPSFYNPTNNGWILEDGKYAITWFEGPQMPLSLDEIVSRKPIEEFEDEDLCLGSVSSEDEDDDV